MNKAPDKRPRLRLPCAGLFLAAIAGVIGGALFAVPGMIWLTAAGVAAGLALVPRLGGFVWLATALAFAALHAGQSRESGGARLAEWVGEGYWSGEVNLRIDEPFKSAGGGAIPRWRARGAVGLAPDVAGQRWIPVLLTWQGDAPPAYGDRILTDASIRRIPPTRNPGEFNARAWYQLAGIYCELSVDASTGFHVTSRQANPLILVAQRSRAAVEQILSIGIAGTVESGVILGMTIGDTRETPEELEDAFREVGVFHLFSVSGLHVGMIATILWFLLGTAGVEKRRAALILIPCVFFYALLTGWKPASVRAATMVALVASGIIIYRQPLALNSLCAAGLILLGINTNELFNPGFQLSFTVVAAILILALPMYRAFESWVAPDPFLPRALIPKWRLGVWDAALGVAGLVSVSLAAWIGSLPLTIYYFNLVSLVSIPANILIVPMAFFSLALAAGSLFTGWVIPLLADLANHANLLVTQGIIGIVSICAAVPGGHFYVAAPMPPGRIVEVTVMDFGSGGASVIRTNDGVWLVDGGESYHGRATLFRYLRELGVNELAGVVLTHGDSRHLGGLTSLADRLPIRTAMESGAPDRSPTRKRLLSQLRNAGTNVIAATPGDTIELSPGVRLTVLFPPTGLEHPFADEKSLVLRLDAGDVSFVFLSDAGSSVEDWLIEDAADQITADILIKGHPRVGDSGSLGFLERAAPKVIIQSASDRRRSESVSPTLIVNTARLGIPMFLQNRTGAVQINVDADGATDIVPFIPVEPGLVLSPSRQRE